MQSATHLRPRNAFSEYHEILMDKLTERTATIGILGLGYVGLPLAVAAAEAGFDVRGIDLSVQKVEFLNSGSSYIPDISSEQILPLVEAGKLHADTEPNCLRYADVIIICVPTPLNKTRDPDMTYVLKATEMVEQILHPGMLVILESTTYPGTTLELLVPKLETDSYKIGKNAFVAFSPERIDPGNKQFTIRNTPKIVGGVSDSCTDLASAFYKVIVDKVIPVSSPTAAEMVKLLENTYRAVNIGLVNEFALMCSKLGVDVWEIIDAAASKPFGFTPFYPGPGLGGHCIPVDPLYLSWKLKALNYTARFIELAREVNTSMPQHVVDRITDALNVHGKSLRNAWIAVLGVAYKRDIDDIRESPALEVINLLDKRGAHVAYHDPFVKHIQTHDGLAMNSTTYSRHWLEAADCVVILTDHSCFDYQEIVRFGRVVIDTRNATNGYGGRSNLIKL